MDVDPAPERLHDIWMTHVNNASDPVYVTKIPELVAEFDTYGPDIGPIGVGSRYSWGIEAYPSGTLLLSDGENPDAEFWLYDLPRDQVIGILTEMGRGDLAAVFAHPWTTERR